MRQRMKRYLAGLIVVLMAIFVISWPALGTTNLDVEMTEEGLLLDDDWQYVGYIDGGITFAIPRDSYDAELDEEYRKYGILLLTWNDDYTVQLRVFDPKETTYEQFKQKVISSSTAKTALRTYENTEIFSYRNKYPDADSELFGIAMTGLDGRLYKISVFTGDSGAYHIGAPVWKIADIINKTVRIQDFSEWGIHSEKEL